jgi:hypothetical protein
MICYKNIEYTWKYGGIIGDLIDTSSYHHSNIVDLCDVLDGYNYDSEFLIKNIGILDVFNYTITSDIILLFDYLQVNFMDRFAKHLIDNKLNFPDIIFPQYISSELVKYTNILLYLQINKITCSNIELTCDHKVSDELLNGFEQSPNQCITGIYNDNISDEGLKNCIYLQELAAFENEKITTCKPFANSLIKLYASGSCGIDDKGLEGCTKLQELDANNNKKITTCYPFANSLIKLYASGSCGINDEGLNKCISLRILYARSNPYITTCLPFAKTLTILQASYNCGINDDGLKECINLQALAATNNNKIISCDPFANTLLALYARGTCGINDENIKKCINLQMLDTLFNNKVCTFNYSKKPCHNWFK